MISMPVRQSTRNRSTQRRSGFSLLEILVTMAVFIMLTAMAMPSMGRAYQAQQLIGAADVVRARFAEARVLSIKTGDIYGFFYEPGAARYFIAPMSQGFRSLQNGIEPSSEISELRNEITFVDGQAAEDSRSADAEESATQDYQSMQPILFYPDGTSQDAVVLLTNDVQDSYIQVNLRGLTGTSSKTRILNPDEALR